MNYSKIKLLMLGVLLAFNNSLYAQKDSTKSNLVINAYLETYYTFVGNQPTHTRPSFIYSHNRSNEVNINLGFIKAAYQNDALRANLSIATGTYMNANYAAEAGVLRNIFEANVGVKVSKSSNLWLDMGVMPSHIGFESAISKDCWNLTRSLMADNSPYFETGAKLSYTSRSEKWFLAGLLLNGWQRIQLVDGNNQPAFGHQITYKPNAKLTLNSSSYLGSDKPDSVKQMRYFHNFYAIYQATDKIGFTVGLDYGVEQKQKGSSQYNSWYSPILICRITPDSKSAIAARIEHYNDKNGVIIAKNTQNGFQTWGYSLNYDYKIKENLLWRVEARAFKSKDMIFMNDNQPQNSNLFFTTSFAISL